MSNKMPAYIVTFPGLTPLYQSCLLTEEEYALEMEKYRLPFDDHPFLVEPYTEDRYNELLASYVQSPEYAAHGFLQELFGSPDFIETHARMCTAIKEHLEAA